VVEGGGWWCERRFFVSLIGRRVSSAVLADVYVLGIIIITRGASLDRIQQNGAKPEKPRLSRIKDYLGVWETQCTVTTEFVSPSLSSTVYNYRYFYYYYCNSLRLRVGQLMRRNYSENKNRNTRNKSDGRSGTYPPPRPSIHRRHATVDRRRSVSYYFRFDYLFSLIRAIGRRST